MAKESGFFNPLNEWAEEKQADDWALRHPIGKASARHSRFADWKVRAPLCFAPLGCPRSVVLFPPENPAEGGILVQPRSMRCGIQKIGIIARSYAMTECRSGEFSAIRRAHLRCVLGVGIYVSLSLMIDAGLQCNVCERLVGPPAGALCIL